MPSSPVLLVLLQLCSLQLMVVAMPTCQLQANVVSRAHDLLRDLRPQFPARCLSYNANITYPESAFPAATASHPHCNRALGVLYETLRGAQEIFRDYDLPEGEGGIKWDNKKVEEYLLLQDRLLDDGSCVSKLSTVDGANVLSSYFGNVTALVEQQDSAFCGWMCLRRDVQEVLERSQQKYPSCFR